VAEDIGPQSGGGKGGSAVTPASRACSFARDPAQLRHLALAVHPSYRCNQKTRAPLRKGPAEAA